MDPWYIWFKSHLDGIYKKIENISLGKCIGEFSLLPFQKGGADVVSRLKASGRGWKDLNREQDCLPWMQ